jgi:hypothetical protein
MPDSLTGRLHGDRAADFSAHVSTCERCKRELDELASYWSKLAHIRITPPGTQLRARFYQALEAYEQGRAERRSAGWSFWWPKQLAVQFALSAGCLAIGLAAGHFFSGGNASADVAELRKEIGNMRQLVTLSLLEQQSASERLRGVTWSYRTEPSDVEVLSALLRTINTDTNVDVRLAAVDAVRNFGNNSVARKGLVQALARQRSPLVEIAIVDTLTDLRAREAIPQFEQILAEEDLDINVRKRMERALEVLR